MKNLEPNLEIKNFQFVTKKTANPNDWGVPLTQINSNTFVAHYSGYDLTFTNLEIHDNYPFANLVSVIYQGTDLSNGIASGQNFMTERFFSFKGMMSCNAQLEKQVLTSYWGITNDSAWTVYTLSGSGINSSNGVYQLWNSSPNNSIDISNAIGNSKVTTRISIISTDCSSVQVVSGKIFAKKSNTSPPYTYDFFVGPVEASEDIVLREL